jgi:hypothetical protein
MPQCSARLTHADALNGACTFRLEPVRCSRRRSGYVALRLAPPCSGWGFLLATGATSAHNLRQNERCLLGQDDCNRSSNALPKDARFGAHALLSTLRGAGGSEAQIPPHGRSKPEMARLDARWLKAHPQRHHRVRLAEHGELHSLSVAVCVMADFIWQRLRRLVDRGGLSSV